MSNARGAVWLMGVVSRRRFMIPDHKNYEERFDALRKMMTNAGLIVAALGDGDAVSVVMSQRGLMVVESIRILDSIGKLSDQDRVYLWHMLAAIADRRPYVVP